MTPKRHGDLIEAQKAYLLSLDDEEVARKAQEEWNLEKNRKLAEAKAKWNEIFTGEYNRIEATIAADRLLAEMIQDLEQSMYTKEQREQFLADTIAEQMRFLAEREGKKT